MNSLPPNRNSPFLKTPSQTPFKMNKGIKDYSQQYYPPNQECFRYSQNVSPQRFSNRENKENQNPEQRLSTFMLIQNPNTHQSDSPKAPNPIDWSSSHPQKQFQIVNLYLNKLLKRLGLDISVNILDVSNETLQDQILYFCSKVLDCFQIQRQVIEERHKLSLQKQMEFFGKKFDILEEYSNCLNQTCTNIQDIQNSLKLQLQQLTIFSMNLREGIWVPEHLSTVSQYSTYLKQQVEEIASNLTQYETNFTTIVEKRHSIKALNYGEVEATKAKIRFRMVEVERERREWREGVRSLIQEDDDGEMSSQSQSGVWNYCS